MIGKAPEKVGKLAIVIHTLNCIFNNQPVTTHISKDVIKAAVKFVMFTASQIDALYTEFSDRTALAPNLVKILTLAGRKGGTISTRDITLAFDSKHRPNKQQIQEWINELAAMKHGEVTTKGQKISFSITPHSTVSTKTPNKDTESDTLIHTSLSTLSTVSTLKELNGSKSVDKCGYIVDNPIHTLKALPDKPLEQSVDTVDTKTPPSEKSENLMMSCTTDIPAQKTPKTPRIFEVGDRVVINDFGGVFHGQRGVIVKSVNYSDRTGLVVKFDKAVSLVREQEFIAGTLMWIKPGIK
jgi:hypothetical protein